MHDLIEISGSIKGYYQIGAPILATYFIRVYVEDPLEFSAAIVKV